MVFLSKNSFFVIFVLCFSVVLVGLGIVQSALGTMRLYNSSEQTYEQLSPHQTYTTTLNRPTLPTNIPETGNSEDILFYLVENKEIIQNALNELPPEKAKKVEEKIKTLQKTYQTPEPVVIQGETNIKKGTSSVEISVIPADSVAPRGYRETLWTVVTGTYFRSALWKFPIIIDTSRVEPRGQMSNESITLSSNILSLLEVSKVLVHEIGHMIDIYTLKRGLQKADPSEEFYALSWSKPNIMKAGLSASSFVSGYAATNQYEDFSESFTMYVFHNKEFLKRARANSILQKKYTFLKTRIFGSVFLGSAYEKTTIPKKVWDVTKIGIKSSSLDTIFTWLQPKIDYAS